MEPDKEYTNSIDKVTQYLEDDEGLVQHMKNRRLILAEQERCASIFITCRDKPYTLLTREEKKSLLYDIFMDIGDKDLFDMYNEYIINRAQRTYHQ